MKTVAPRKDFLKGELNESVLPSDPLTLFSQWWQEAIAEKVLMPDAAVLSTLDENLKPDARVIFIKHFDEQGLVFFTNYQSAKAQQLAIHPDASLTIFWPEREQQIRVRGRAEKCSFKESETYFKSRPKEAQLGAWASPQSQSLSSREELMQFYDKVLEQFLEDVPCPPYWGGFRVQPLIWEFWQGRINRLHDRFRYALQENKSWKIERLAP